LENAYLQWWEFQPTSDLYLIRVHPDYSKTESPTGIIIATQPSKVVDRPTTGEIVSRGSNASKYDIGFQVFFAPNRGFDLNYILTEGEEKFMLVAEENIDGIRVKDTRESENDQ